MRSVNPYYFSGRKRLFDIVLSLLLFCLLSPLLLIISFSIMIIDGWPILFSQKRVGQNNHNFTLYKFRTMKNNAEKIKKKYAHLNEAPWPMFKITDDPRFTRTGKILSKSGLDELPQLYNIFLGKMSFIGPRPLPISEARKLKKIWDFRHLVKPGVFSEWTIAEERHQSLAKWRRLDKRTLNRGGIMYDVSMIRKTIDKVIKSLK